MQLLYILARPASNTSRGIFTTRIRDSWRNHRMAYKLLRVIKEEIYTFQNSTKQQKINSSMCKLINTIKVYI